MAEYIDREALAMRVLGLTIVDPMVASYADAVLFQIQQAPAADVVEVKHGRWVQSGQCNHKPCRIRNADKWTTYKCSECGFSNGRRFNDNYCPNCGAKMDGGA